MEQQPVTYVKTEWVNDNAPDIDADHLNKMEQGIADAHDGFALAQSDAGAAKSDAASAVSTVNGHLTDRNNPHVVTARQIGTRHLKNAVKRGAKAQAGFDNTVIFQTILDEITNEGGGEFYLPGDSGAVYETKNLWIQGSNTRIVSEGAQMKFTAQSPYARGTSFAGLDFTKANAAVAPSGLILEGLTVNIAYDLGTETIVGIAIDCDNAVVQDCTVIGIPKDSIYVGGYQGGRADNSSRNVRVERCQLIAARRNVISITGVVGCWIDKCVISGSTASDPGSPGATNPGAGIDIEPNFRATPITDIWITDCVVDNNGGAGIAIVPSGAADNLSIDIFNNIYLLNNRIWGNGASASASTSGGIDFLQYGQTNGEASVLVQGNSIQYSQRGYGIRANCPLLCLRLLDNDVRHNAYGAIQGSAYHSGSLGFSWSGSTSYDDGRNLRTN